MSSSIIETHDSNSDAQRPRRWGLIALTGVLVVALVFAIVALPVLAKRVAVSKLSAFLDRPVSIERLGFNPFTGVATATGVSIGNKRARQALLMVDTAQARIQSSLWQPGWRIDPVTIDGPTIRLVRRADGRWNVDDLVHPSDDAHSQGPGGVLIDRLRIRDGRITVVDESIAAAPSRTLRVTELRAEQVPGASQHFQIHLSAQIPEGGDLIVGGQIDPESSAGTLTISAKDVALSPFQPYLHNPLTIAGIAGGLFTMEWPGRDDTAFVLTGTLAVQDFRLADDHESLLKWESGKASGIDVQWPTHAAIQDLSLQAPKLWVRRDARRNYPDLRLLVSRPNSTATEARDRPTSEGHALSWRIVNATAADGTLVLRDEAVNPTYTETLTEVNFAVSNLESGFEHPIGIEGTAGTLDGGTLSISAEGRFGEEPARGHGRLRIVDFPIPPANPYLMSAVSHRAKHGRLTTDMQFKLSGSYLDVDSDISLAQLDLSRGQGPDVVRKRIGLPLGLVMDLLRNLDGTIRLRLPVSGPLEDPSFEWTQALWRSLRKVLMNVVIAPFRAVGRFFSSDSERSGEGVRVPTVAFQPGSATIKQTHTQRVAAMATLLSKSTDAVLELTPVLSHADVEALRRMPKGSWPVPAVATAEKAARYLAVRRAYVLAADLRHASGVSADRLSVIDPVARPDGEDVPRVEFTLTSADEVEAT
ncbi:hypothetical protein YTPLAS18_15370 [Nitrospira sp.]|nr:hypothetical protein YTPLAS18_15370 [Nitrospira sp.]